MGHVGFRSECEFVILSKLGMSELWSNKSGIVEVWEVGVTGLVGVYYIGARMQPQLIDCALAQELGCP